MVLITFLIALSTSLYSLQTLRLSASVHIISEITTDVGARSGIVSVGPILIGSTNGGVLRRVYVAGGAVKTKVPQIEVHQRSTCVEVTVHTD